MLKQYRSDTMCSSKTGHSNHKCIFDVLYGSGSTADDCTVNTDGVYSVLKSTEKCSDFNTGCRRSERLNQHSRFLNEGEYSAKDDG